MNANGFVCQKASDPVSVVYTRGDLFLMVSYYPEDAPRYTISSTTGIIRGTALNGSPLLDGLALWKLSPPEGERKEVLYFTNQHDLKERLQELRNKLIDPVAKPLWGNRFELSHLLDEQRELLQTESEGTVATQLRARAASAFKGGRYRDVVDNLSQVAPGKLSASDARRLLLARKYLAESS